MRIDVLNARWGKQQQAARLERRQALKTPGSQFVTRQFTDSQAVRDIAGQEAAYKLFGMIPDTLKLQPFLTSLLEEQIDQSESSATALSDLEATYDADLASSPYRLNTIRWVNCLQPKSYSGR